MRIVHFKSDAKLDWKVFRDKGAWVGVCDALGITLVEDIHAELVAAVVEAIDDLMRDLFISGELPQFLTDRGWSLSQQISPLHLMDDLRFDLPFDLQQIPHCGVHPAKRMVYREVQAYLTPDKTEAEVAAFVDLLARIKRVLEGGSAD